jgi:long-chain acyl-CoA synthetase
VVAFVQLIQGARTKPADLMGHLRDQLAPYKRPSEIIVLDTLPATSSGKILKHQLAQSLKAPTGGAAAG